MNHEEIIEDRLTRIAGALEVLVAFKSEEMVEARKRSQVTDKLMGVYMPFMEKLKKQQATEDQDEAWRESLRPTDQPPENNEEKTK